MAQEDEARRRARLHARENSTLVFATVAASASLLFLIFVLDNFEPTQITDWVRWVGFLFSILGPLYREVTIFTIDGIDYRKIRERDTYPIWATLPRMVIVRVFLYLPIAAWWIFFENPANFWMTVTFIAAFLFSVLELLSRDP